MINRIKNILQESTQNFLLIDSSSMPPEDMKLLDLFMRGYCQEFAIALNKKTGFHLMRVVLKGYNFSAEFAHAFVKVSSGIGLDASGEHKFKDIIANQEKEIPTSQGTWYEIRPASEFLLKKSTQGHGLDQSMIEKAEMYIDKYILKNQT
jgi:hypothetical protein